jgi:hypothetical protein
MGIRFKSCTFVTCDRLIHGASITVWTNGTSNPSRWGRYSVKAGSEIRELIGLID